MSSENCVRIVMAENLRFLGEGSSAQGKPGAKARPEGVADAQQADIPAPPAGRYSTDGATEKDKRAGFWTSP